MGIETNTTDQNKALPPAFHSNWSQMESIDTVSVQRVRLELPT